MLNKEGEDDERLSWDALARNINGVINKVNASNISDIIPELSSENLIRGRGLLCKSLLDSQLASPASTNVFAAVAAVVNTRIPAVGHLLLTRLILLLKQAYTSNDKPHLRAAVKYLAHLINQQVAAPQLALQLVILLLEHPTDDSIAVAVEFVQECGFMIQKLCPNVSGNIYGCFRHVLYQGDNSKRVTLRIKGLFDVRRGGFRRYPAVRPELHLVRPNDVITHNISLDDSTLDDQTCLDVFKPDPDFLENEKRYQELMMSILESSSTEPQDEEEVSEEEEAAWGNGILGLWARIRFIIMSCDDYEQAGHKLMKIGLDAGQHMEICEMLLNCCWRETPYRRFYGLLGAKLCELDKVYRQGFGECFRQQYATVHLFPDHRIYKMAKFFAHLLATDALHWSLLFYVHLTEQTTSSSRIFLMTLLQELAVHLGIPSLYGRFTDPTMQSCFHGIFPKDSVRNTRFSINFFVSIGLPGLTDHLREHLNTNQ